MATAARLNGMARQCQVINPAGPCGCGCGWRCRLIVDLGFPEREPCRYPPGFVRTLAEILADKPEARP